ncbi:hypothetical protein F2Q69_00040959 [Brassica cretica]|uniref:Uncharacterized protein n=1 Tax=Brassica cretica TaxID=69181 RepID=A0A8S9N6P2_BRACR|nr:hypothetical protein F2Q69_00040959 [Brassica cretica]
MWFPIHEAIVRALDRFELSISQLNVAALQNFLGMLILSYELRMDLSPDDFEGLWSTRKTSIDYLCRMAPKRHMSIIQGHTSNAKGWFKRFFYVRIDSAFVEENCLPLFRGKWNFHRANSILPAIPRDLFAKRDLLRNGPFFWDSFTLDRIRNAVALYRSRGISRPLRASDMDEPHPDAVPDQRERVRPRKDKGIALEDRNFVSEDLPLPDGTRVSPRVMGVEPARLLFRTTSLPTSLPVLLLQRHWMKRRGEKWSRKGMRVFNSTLDRSFREARLSHFKAEEIERKFIRFQNEVAERARRQAMSHSRALIRAERKGRRTIAAELARRASLFDAEFRSFMDAQDDVAEMSGLMDGCAQAESMVPPIKGRIRELWEPIEVSEDTTEVGADAADKGGEVDQPMDSFGASISGPSVAVRYLSVLWPCEELVFVQGLLGRFGRAIGIQEEVFYACDLRNFAGEELRSKPCAENLAVHSGMTSGLVELAVGIILELVPGPGISGSLSWNMMRTFIIQMSIRSSLVGPGTRWIEPKKELFEKGLYRPKKWKDKPAWFMIGPI